MKKILSVVLALALVLSMSTAALAATGLGSYTSVSAAAAGDKNGSVSANTTMCALSIDEEGKITAISFDVVQVKASFDTKGAVAGEVNAEPQTKRELGEGYGMKAISPIGKEYYEQMDALEAWCIGKTVEEVLTLLSSDNGYISDDVDVKASCTVGVADQLKALEKAFANAK